MNINTRNLITSIEGKMPAPYEEYKELVTPSEVPQEFHPFVFLTMVSALIRDKVFFLEGNDKIYPNLWTLLVGKSSVSRKSTAISPALKYLTLIQSSDVYLLASSGSPEGLFDDIVKAKGVGILCHPELGSFLGALKKDYMRGSTEQCCQYYDPATSASIQKKLAGAEKVSIDHLAITWLACTTQTSLKGQIVTTDDRIASGFLPRFNIVLGSPVTEFVPFRPHKGRDKQEAFARKITSLVKRSKSEFGRDKKATKIFDEWYREKRKMAEQEIEEDVLGYFQIRTLEVVKKYAVILAVLKGNKNNVDEEIMIQAILIGEYFLNTSRRLVQTELNASKDEQIMQRILTIAKKHEGSVTHRLLLQYTHMTTKALRPYIETLVSRGDISISEDGNIISFDPDREGQDNRESSAQSPSQKAQVEVDKLKKGKK